MLALKPFVFSRLLAYEKETKRLSLEIGVRLGQMSEFSLLIGVLSLSAGLVSERAFYLIQAATLVTFVGSSYLDDAALPDTDRRQPRAAARLTEAGLQATGSPVDSTAVS